MAGGKFTRGFTAREFTRGLRPRGKLAAPPPLARSRIPPATQAKDFFNLFVSDELFEAFLEETNRYARQCIAHKPDKRWRETNMEEMKAYFGLNILFGIKKLPDTDLYWSKDAALGVPYVQKVMPRDLTS